MDYYDAYEALWYDTPDCMGDPRRKSFSSKKRMYAFYKKHKDDPDKTHWWLRRLDADGNVTIDFIY